MTWLLVSLISANLLLPSIPALFPKNEPAHNPRFYDSVGRPKNSSDWPRPRGRRGATRGTGGYRAPFASGMQLVAQHEEQGGSPGEQGQNRGARLVQQAVECSLVGHRTAQDSCVFLPLAQGQAIEPRRPVVVELLGQSPATMLRSCLNPSLVRARAGRADKAVLE